MKTIYAPEGVCAYEMEVNVENGIVQNVEIRGGCSGNTQGICRLVEGMKVGDAISKMKGIRCGWKNTSCPDQLARALEVCQEETMK